MEVGLDRIVADAKLAARLRGRKVGLLAHPASVDRQLRHVGGLLRGLGARIEIAFGPEHGYGGEAQDMIGVGDAFEDRVHRPVGPAAGEHVDALAQAIDDLRLQPHVLTDGELVLPVAGGSSPAGDDAEKGVEGG